jgi:HSP20 family molecular chaperone IbpA
MNINETTTAPTETNVMSSDRPVFIPAADIYETPDAVLIRCDMPGVAEADLEITLSNKVLALSGKQLEPDTGGRETSACEYLTGIYRRSFNINRDLDESAVKARMKDGVLEIELPKAKEAQPRRIPIEN